MAFHFVSARDSIKTAIDDFLRSTGLRSADVLDGLLSVVEKLKAYREEGKRLTPELYLFRESDFEQVVKMVGARNVLLIGSAENSPKGYETALKKCAPLAREGWHIYLALGGVTLAFGIFRQTGSIIAVPLEHHFVGPNEGGLPTILVRQLADNILELKGSNQCHLEIHYSSKEKRDKSWTEHQLTLVKSLVKDVPKQSKEQADIFFGLAIKESILHGHGFLIAVVAKGKKLPKALTSGTVFDAPLCISSRISVNTSERTIGSYSEVVAALPAITGMIASDGITVLDTAGRVLAFNVFIALENGNGVPVVGGARRRTYEMLVKMAKKGTLVGVFFQSQDGESEWTGGKNGR